MIYKLLQILSFYILINIELYGQTIPLSDSISILNKLFANPDLDSLEIDLIIKKRDAMLDRLGDGQIVRPREDTLIFNLNRQNLTQSDSIFYVLSKIVLDERYELRHRGMALRQIGKIHSFISDSFLVSKIGRLVGIGGLYHDDSSGVDFEVDLSMRLLVHRYGDYSILNPFIAYMSAEIPAQKNDYYNNIYRTYVKLLKSIMDIGTLNAWLAFQLKQSEANKTLNTNIVNLQKALRDL
jgi:hypothetical protein